jgi:predicted SAM-dependent methyltransferase
MNIEFGCGETPTKEGFKTCDIRDLPGIDFVCSAWDIDKLVEENSVNEIFSRHFFEHLTFKQGEYLLTVWHKILKPGGRIEMMIPNMRAHVQQWIDGDSRAARNIYGHQRGEFDDLWDVHKSGYDIDSLHALVKKYNFVNYNSLGKEKSKHIHVEFFKR